MPCFCTTACRRRLARCSFLAFHTRINEPVIGVAFHGGHAKHLQADHFKDGLQLTQLSGHYSSHQGAQGRWRRGATNPILDRDLREHAAIVFVRQLIFPAKSSRKQPRNSCRQRDYAIDVFSRRGNVSIEHCFICRVPLAAEVQHRGHVR